MPVEQLRELVALHGVRYERWPEYHYQDGKKIAVGFSLELYGIHRGQVHLSPGDHESMETFEDLRRIAESVLPREDRSTRYEVEPYDPSLYIDPRKPERSEVALKVKIFHRLGFFHPVDESEEQRLAEMERGLEELGVRRGR
ncbi:MAG: hypothetical protein IANPNBLG_03719 [Bryobacteraceae bacterium]|nr:hypothetical protein [Bryobacteraceae bacterium]